MAYDGSLIFDTKINAEEFKEGLSKLGGVAVKATAAVGAALAGMGAYASKASIDFESAFAGVRKTVDATEEDFLLLEQGIRNMAKAMPQSAVEIATVAEAAGQLGIEVVNILSFTETMVMLGDATDLSSEQAAMALARLAKITGMSQKDFDRLGSTIVALGNNFETTESEIVEMGLRLAGTGNQVGLVEHEIMALASAMSSVGINAEAGGSSMSRVMQKINTEVLSVGDNLNQFAEISGMSADEFSKAWKDKPTEAILAFISGLDSVNKNGGDVSSMLKELGINSIQEIDTMLRLSGANESLANALSMSAIAWEENIALAEEAEQRYKTTESQIEILKNMVTDLAISVGDELKESLTGVIDTSKTMVDQLANAFNQGGFAGLVNEIGNVLAEIIVSIAKYAPVIFDAAVNLITSFINGIRENLPSIANSAIEIMQSFITAIIDIIPDILTLGIELVITLIEGIAEMLPDLATQAIDLVILIADTIINNIPMIIQTGIKIIMALVQGIVNNLPKLISEVPRIINSFAGAIYDNLPTILKAAVEIILTIIKGLIDSIPTLIANIPQIIMAIVNVITLYNWWNLGKGIITKFKDGIVSMVKNLANATKNLATEGIEAIKMVFSDAPRIGKGLVEHLITGVKILAESLVTTVKNMGTNAINGIKDIFKGAFNIGSDLVKGIWNGINSVKDWILDKISGFGSSIIGGIKGVFGIQSPSTVMRDEVGVQLVKGIGEGIVDEIPALRNLSAKEMDKLISDYGQYGKDAAKQYAKLSKSEMDKIVKDSKKSGQNIAESIAKGIEDKTNEISSALDKIRSETVKQLDRLGEATVTALRRRYQEEERIQLDSLRKQTENIKNETDKRIQEYDRELQAKLQLLDDGTNEELKQLQEAIDGINNRTKEEEKQLEEQEYNRKISLLEKELLEAKSSEEQLKIIDELSKLKADRERKLLLESRQMQVEALRAEMDRVRNQATEKRTELEKEYAHKKEIEENKLSTTIYNLDLAMEATKEHYAALLEEDALQAEARLLMLDENNQELVYLLESYNPKWHDAGQSFGESLLDGLNSMKQSIQYAVDDILSMVSTADMANARIIQAKQDWHEAELRGDQTAMDEAHRRAEEYRKQGGTIQSTDSLDGLVRQMQSAVVSESQSTSRSVTAGTSTARRAVENIENNSDNRTTITGNNFIIREEVDIKKTAVELERLRQSKLRGKGVGTS